MRQQFIQIHPEDTVAVALCPLKAGQQLSVNGRTVTLLNDIPQGHKFALKDFGEGASIIKYGAPIGVAHTAIRTGEWVHTHNMKTGLGGLLSYTYEKSSAPSGPKSLSPSQEPTNQDPSSRSLPSWTPSQDGQCLNNPSDNRLNNGHFFQEDRRSGDCCTPSLLSGTKRHSFQGDRQSGDCCPPSLLSGAKRRFFQGYRRSGGAVGIRNEIWIIPTVGCVNNVAAAIERRTQSLVGGTIDAILAFSHPYGCSQMGEDQENTRRILADLVRHPNAGGVLVLGLGCENSPIEELKTYIGPYDARRVKFLVAQEAEDEVGQGAAMVEELTAYARLCRREPISCKELIVGLKCGGSDGFSGITANPIVGAFSDRLIAEGGTTILTEVPEMFGAETLLMNRCENEALFCQTVALINDFKNYFTSHHQTIYENPSPGNKAGGISTLEDKSMGCVQKSGSAPVRGVLAYGERVRETGLNLLSAPGNDLVASTALAASGAQLILFTTGRGTPFAAPVPTIKISSNTALYQKKQNWIDFDCGVLADGADSAELSEQLFDFVIDVASGRKVRSEEAGFHDMAIFKQGVTL